MMKKTYISLIILLFSGIILAQETKKVPINFCLSKEAKEVIAAINTHRQKLALDPLEISLSLSYIAYLHAMDLHHYTNIDDESNKHSWSENGDWIAIKHPANTSRTNTPWNKPIELSDYKARGYELIYCDSHTPTIENAMIEWKKTAPALGMFSNTGSWSKFQWKAIGAYTYEEYIIIWFGEKAPTEKVRYCN